MKMLEIKDADRVVYKSVPVFSDVFSSPLFDDA